MPPLGLGAGGDDFVEVAKGRRLAVAGKGDVVESPQVLRQFAELFGLINVAGKNQPQADIQFVEQPIGFDKRGFGRGGAIDLAINAIEVADLVGIQIHAERNPLRPPAEHGIHKAEILERALVVGEERLIYERVGHIY